MSKIVSAKNKVIIIGAGAAGLGAAEYLYRNGIQDVIILEANNRIGGRIHTVHFGRSADKLVELGANWIHGGTCANPVHTLQAQNGFVDRDGQIPYLERFKHCYFSTSNGRLIEDNIGMRVVDLFFLVERAAYMLFFQETPSITPEMNLMDYMRREINVRLEKEFAPEEQAEAERAFNSLLNYLTFHTSDDLEKLSLKQYGTFQEIPGGDAIVPGGFSNLIAKVADTLPSDCVKLNKRVIRIDWSSKSPTNGVRSKVTLECDDGTVWEAEHAIITVSLGYLKRHHEKLFHPRLPDHKMDAIAKIGFGCTDKIFLEFERPFWVQHKMGVLAIGWSNRELEEGSQDSEWEKSIFGFEEVYDNPNVLLCWLAGRGAESMESVPDSDVIDTCTRLLRRFTGNSNIPKPMRMRRTKWRQDPLILGAYSYATPLSGLPEISNLARPEPSPSEPVLLFAGEATHPNYYSTVHGAMLTGIREAQRIIALNSSALKSKF